MVGSEQFESHRAHLAKVPQEVTEQRLRRYRLSPDVLTVALPPICGDILVEVPTEQKQFMHPLEPLTLDDLKNWFGVPNEIARRQISRNHRLCGDDQQRNLFARVKPKNLPQKKSFEFGKLEPEQQVAVKHMARNLLYSYVSEDEAKQREVGAVVTFMLDRMSQFETHIVVIPDLIVCPDHTVELNNVPAALFNNILIYGNGQIKANSPLSINAHQIRHINV